MTGETVEPNAPKTVNVADPSAGAYWARYFQTPVEQIEAAVAAVGHEPAKVAAYIGRPWPFEDSGIV